MANPLVRGFLGRVGGHAAREEKRRQQRALIVVSEDTDYLHDMGV